MKEGWWANVQGTVVLAIVGSSSVDVRGFQLR